MRDPGLVTAKKHLEHLRSLQNASGTDSNELPDFQKSKVRYKKLIKTTRGSPLPEALSSKKPKEVWDAVNRIINLPIEYQWPEYLLYSNSIKSLWKGKWTPKGIKYYSCWTGSPIPTHLPSTVRPTMKSIILFWTLETIVPAVTAIFQWSFLNLWWAKLHHRLSK